MNQLREIHYSNEMQIISKTSYRSMYYSSLLQPEGNFIESRKVSLHTIFFQNFLFVKK